MRLTPWTTWLTASNTDPIYLLLNTLATPNPTDLLFANDWVEQAFPIYNGTALAHLIGQSPWLVKLKPSAYAPLGQLLDRKGLSDNTWGWAYRSSLDWQYQLRHWQNRQLVELNEELVVLRLMDTRIANVLIPKMREVDWSVLMTPVHEVMLETPSDPAFFESPTRHNPLPIPELQARPFIMGEHLQAAWENSAQFIELLAENLACELWENHAEVALSLDTPEGQLHRRLVDWLHLHPSLAGDIHTRTATQFTDYAQQQGWLTTTTEPS
ncbi:DUF4123 domain-containing protein [Providencia sp. PROV100]|uniref:DUF4123 domain-containing protein n=1 Tax=Providencia sp. PROV100 TaxID=2936785 RepID=UPI0029902B57|nr:DUF4123 domain-containing protein [Providencia sp. PROV100]